MLLLDLCVHISGSGRSSPRSSPYTSQYANLSSLQNTYNTSPVSQTYSTSMYGNPQMYNTSASYGQYSSSNVRSNSPARYSPSSPRQAEESGVTYAQIAPRSESGVTYAQIAPRSDRPVPGPQVPIQIKVAETKQQTYQSPSQSQYSRSLPGQQQASPGYPSSSMSPRGGSSKEEEVDALTQMLMQGLEGTKDPDFFGRYSEHNYIKFQIL